MSWVLPDANEQGEWDTTNVLPSAVGSSTKYWGEMRCCKNGEWEH